MRTPAPTPCGGTARELCRRRYIDALLDCMLLESGIESHLPSEEVGLCARRLKHARTHEHAHPHMHNYTTPRCAYLHL